MRARASFLVDLGLDIVEQEMNGSVISSVAADPQGATNVPGVFAAGNVTDARATVMPAAAAGLTAAGGINADLITEETRLAVAARSS
jgi:thioredoxin reductase (NADPH)